MLASFPPIGDLVATAVPPRIADRKEKKVCRVNVGPVNRIGAPAATGVLSLVTNLKSNNCPEPQPIGKGPHSAQSWAPGVAHGQMDKI